VSLATLRNQDKLFFKNVKFTWFKIINERGYELAQGLRIVLQENSSFGSFRKNLELPGDGEGQGVM
jgi:hypothetical protein